MSSVCLSYEDFATLCDQLLGGPSDAPQQVPRLYGSGIVQARFRGRWYMALCQDELVLPSSRFAAGGRFGLRRLGFPRCRR